MSLMLLTMPATWPSLQNLFRWLTPRQSAIPQPASLPPIFEVDTAINSVAKCAHRTRAEDINHKKPVRRRALRIVRVMEAGQSPAQVGRMVISGRMADVCAELDRLAACEAAQHRH